MREALWVREGMEEGGWGEERVGVVLSKTTKNGSDWKPVKCHKA